MGFFKPIFGLQFRPCVREGPGTVQAQDSGSTTLPMPHSIIPGNLVLPPGAPFPTITASVDW